MSMEREWTIRVCPKCGFMDPDQYNHGDRPPRTCPMASRGLSRHGVILHPYPSSEDYDPDTAYVEVVVVAKA